MACGGTLTASPGSPVDVVAAAGGRAPARAEEEALVRAAAAGDGAAFERIYDAHAGGLYGYALRRLGDPGRAEDLVQEVFLAVLRRGRSYRGWAPLGAFLYRIARNRVINVWRDARPELPAIEPATEPHPEAVIDVRRALARLAPKFREPIALATYEGLSYEEIASVLECPIGTVRSRIARGKSKLAALLAEGRR